MEDPIFIVGIPRTGSTLWHNIIAINSKLFRLAEMHFLNPWHKDFRYFCRKHVGDLSKEKNIEKMIDMLLSRKNIPGITGAFWRFENIEVIKDPEFKKALHSRVMQSDKSFGSIFKILVEEITRFSGCSRCCIKFPVYVNHVPELLRWFPRSKIIHITRDPRAIAASKTNDPSGTGALIKRYPLLKFFIRKMIIFFVIIQYIWTSKLHNKYQKYENYSLFRYEDLLLDPEGVIRELCKFVKIKFMPEMVEPQRGRHKHQPSSLTGKQQKAFDKKAAVRWRTKISPLEKYLIAMLTKTSMKRFGYDPKKHPIYFNTFNI